MASSSAALKSNVENNVGNTSRTRGLRSWKPGQSGNPKGRPKKEHSLTDALRAKASPLKLAETLWDLAINKKDFQAVKYIYDRLEGSPAQMSQEALEEQFRNIAKEYGVPIDKVKRDFERLRLVK